MLHGTAEVPEVGRGAQQVAVGLQHISTGDTVSAGRRTTSTPSMSGSVAPATTASNIYWQCGDGVWWMMSRRGTSLPDP